MKIEKIAKPEGDDLIVHQAKSVFHVEYVVAGLIYIFVVAIGFMAWFST